MKLQSALFKMPDDPHPRIEADGTHVIPLVELRDREGNPLRLIEGTITWTAKQGVVCEIQFEEGGLQNLKPPTKANEKGQPVRRLNYSSTELAFTGRAINGAKFAIYGFSLKGARRQSSSNDTTYECDELRHITRVKLVDRPIFVVADVPVDNEFAFDQLGAEKERAFLVGLKANYLWQELNGITRQSTTGECTSTTHSWTLSENPKVVVRSNSSLFNIKTGVFLCYDTPIPTTLEGFLEDYGRQDRAFFSFLTGTHTTIHWREWDIAGGQVRRVYFGKNREFTDSGRSDEPIPLFRYVTPTGNCQEAARQLPKMFTKFREMELDNHLIMFLMPIWIGTKYYLEDRLALASISVERFTKFASGLHKPSASATVITPNEWQGLRPRLDGVVNEFFSSDDSPGNLEKRQFLLSKLKDLNQPPNKKKMENTFKALGITLSDKETTALKSRNREFHGGSVKSGKLTLEQKQQILDDFDTLMTLVNKGILRLLDYRGPYVDYSTRPAEGNCAINRL